MSTIYNEYFAHYIGLVNNEEVLEAMQHNKREFLSLIAEIDEEKSMYRYAEGKWSIKELITHIIDSERIFAYRALRFARNDKTDLAGFDENQFAANSKADNRPFTDIAHEFVATRQSSFELFSSFDSEMLSRTGTANEMEIDVTSLGYLIAGHCQHHINVLRERYLGA